MQFFNVPAVLNEILREPIKQFGMRWQFSLAAEIFRCRNNSATEMHFPNAIHHDARGKRILFINEPLRQPKPVLRIIFWKRKNLFGRSRFDLFAARIVSAAF